MTFKLERGIWDPEHLSYVGLEIRDPYQDTKMSP